MTTQQHGNDNDRNIEDHQRALSSNFHTGHSDHDGDRYKAVEKIGNGAYGVVFKCRDTYRDDRFVCLLFVSRFINLTI